VHKREDGSRIRDLGVPTGDAFELGGGAVPATPEVRLDGEKESKQVKNANAANGEENREAHHTNLPGGRAINSDSVGLQFNLISLRLNHE
jgi:hypothetical protein